MEDIWNQLSPLLAQLWAVLTSIVMICVDWVLGVGANFMEVPLETWKPYELAHENENVTTAVILIVVFLFLRRRTPKTVVTKTVVQTPSTQANTSTTQSRLHQERPSPAQCSHSWDFTHKGYDEKYPRGHYECHKCGTRGVEENLGEGPIVAQ